MDKKGKKFNQMTIGAWKGFKKTVTHNNKEVVVKIPETTMIEEKNIPCAHCPKRFKTNSNLAVHLKCKHPENPDLPLPNVSFRLTTGEKLSLLSNRSLRSY